MSLYNNQYDDKRPQAGNPILENGDANALWVGTAWECERYADENGTDGMSQEEICLAVTASMASEIPNGGTRQWLLHNMSRPAVAAQAVHALHHMGSHGMGNFIERIMEATLGPRGEWVALSPDEWRKHQEHRETALEKRNRYTTGVTAKTSLEKMGMSRDEFFAFLFDCERACAESGDVARYQRWYDAHAMALPMQSRPRKSGSLISAICARLMNFLPGKRPVLAGSVYVNIGSIKGGMHCFPLANPDEAGSTGYWYWENEFLAACYEFTGNTIGKIREELRAR